MKKILSILLISSVLSMEGCFNYRDINKLFFSTVAVVDVDDNGDVILYSENFKAYRGEGEKQGTEVKVIFKGTGVTVFDAYTKIMETASYEINYSQLRAIVFTERAARYGIDNFVDAAVRDQKPTLREFLFVYPGNPEELLKVTPDDEMFLGLFLENLMVSQGKLANVVQIRLNEYMNKRLTGSRTTVIPIIKITNTASEQRIATNGAAVIVDDKMVDKLSDEEVIPYNYVINEAKSGFLYAKNPAARDRFVSLKILANKTRFSLDYDGETVQFTKNIKTKVTLVEAQKFLTLSNDDVRKQIEKDAEERTSELCVGVFKRFQEKGIDIFNVQREFEKRYPHEKVENVLEITKANTNVDVFIEGSNNISDFE